jgi:phosphoenolpyruvate synthase/pyruvate phosphate dikinase
MLVDLSMVEPPILGGGKASGLRLAQSLGMRVPPSAVVPPGEIERLKKEPSYGDRIATSIDSWAVDRGITHVAIRSSAAAEDSARHSYAGVFKSAFSAADTTGISAALCDVVASLNSPQRVAYEAVSGIASGSTSMAILVQATVPPRSSGVMFTWGDAGDPQIRIQATWGLSVDVVSGVTTGDAMELRTAKQVAKSRAGEKPLVLMPVDPCGYAEPGDFSIVNLVERDSARGGVPAKVLHVDKCAGLAYLRVPEAFVTSSCLDPSLVEQLRNIAERRPPGYDLGTDFEWIEDVTGQVWIVQMRPITSPQPPIVPAGKEPEAATAFHNDDSSKVVHGEPGAPGQAEGNAATGPAIMGGRANGSPVLICAAARPELMPAISRASALISSDGGLLCHVAIVARELGKPCVIGVRNATTRFTDGEALCVDGTAGTIRRIADPAPRSESGPDSHPVIDFVDISDGSEPLVRYGDAMTCLVGVLGNEQALSFGERSSALLARLRHATVLLPRRRCEAETSQTRTLRRSGFEQITHLRHWIAFSHYSKSNSEIRALVAALKTQGVS